MPDGQHAIVSELPANMKHSDSHQVAPLPVDVKPEAGWGEAACVSPPRNFGTHGIHVAKRKDGRLQLLAVNHDERAGNQSRLARMRSLLRRRLQRCSFHGRRFLCGRGHHEQRRWQAARPRGIHDKRQGHGLGRGVDTKRRLPSSAELLRTDAGRCSAQSQWPVHLLHVVVRQGHPALRPNAGEVVQTTHTVYYPDNLSVRADGTLLVAGLDDLAAWKECFMAKAAFCRESSTVATVNTQTLQTDDVLHLPAGFLSGVSVAVQTGRSFVLVSPSGDRILVVSHP